MFSIFDKQVLKIRRGNSAEIRISLIDSKTDESIIISSEDRVLFTVKNRNRDTVIQRILTLEDMDEGHAALVLNLEPSETMLITGEYRYDVLLVTGDGAATTFISSALIIEPSLGLYTDIWPTPPVPDQYELYVGSDGRCYVGSDGKRYMCRKE